MRWTFAFLMVACGGGISDPGPGPGRAPDPVPDHPDADTGNPRLTDCPDDAKQGLLVTGLGADEPWALAAGGGRVYWSVLGGGVLEPESGAIGWVERCGGVAKRIPQQTAPYALAADFDGACWANLGTTVQGAYQNDGVIRCFDRGELVTIATDQRQPGSIALDGAFVSWMNHATVALSSSARMSNPSPRSLWQTHQTVEVSGLATYDHVTFAGTTEIVALESMKPRTIATSVGEVAALAVDHTFVYFIANHVLHAVPKSAGPVTVLGAAVGHQIFADGRGWVYYLGQGSVRRTSVDGSDEFVATTTSTYGFGMDDAYVYTVAGGNLYRTPKR